MYFDIDLALVYIMNFDILHDLHDLKDDQIRMIKALCLNKFNATKAAETANVSVRSHYNWLKLDPNYKEGVDYALWYLVDNIKDKLIEKVEEGDIRAIIFALETLGKEQGFIKTQKIDNTVKIEGKPTINLEFSES